MPLFAANTLANPAEFSMSKWRGNPLLLLGPVNQAAVLVGSQGAMDEPLGIPGGFESACRGFPIRPKKNGTPKVPNGDCLA